MFGCTANLNTYISHRRAWPTHRTYLWRPTREEPSGCRFLPTPCCGSTAAVCAKERPMSSGLSPAASGLRHMAEAERAAQAPGCSSTPAALRGPRSFPPSTRTADTRLRRAGAHICAGECVQHEFSVLSCSLLQYATELLVHMKTP